MGELIQRLIQAFTAEVKTPVGWIDILTIAFAYYFLHNRRSEYEEMVKGLLAQGNGYAQAVSQAKVLLDRKLPDELLMLILLGVLIISLILSYRAYVRSLRASGKC